MKYTRTMGIAVPEMQWVPSPTYILRRAAILDWLKTYAPGKVLEIGCGPGALLYDLKRLGFCGVGVEVSEKSRALAQEIFKSGDRVEILDSLPEGQEGTFDYLFAFEVLEHVEDDYAALIDWLTYLKPGGVVFISVPAHRKRWNVTDIAAGHYRRYDREDILGLVRHARLQVDRIGTYGWPASSINEVIRARVKARQLAKGNIAPASIVRGDISLSKASGADRRIESRLYPFYGSLIGKMFFRVAMATQRLFYNSSLGISFLVIARKPS